MNTNSRTKNSIRNLVTGIGSNLLLTVIRFVCRTVLINTLGSAYLGINGLFSDILSMLSLTELGLDVAMNYKLYKPLAENDMPRIRALMKFYRYAYIVVGLVILGLGLLLIPFLPALIKDYDSITSLGLSPVLIFVLYLSQSASSYLFFASKNAILKANQEEYILSVVGFISQFALNIAQIVTLVFLKNFTVYVALSIGFSILSNFLIALIAQKKYPEAFNKSDDKLSLSEIKDFFKDLGGAFIYKINNTVLHGTSNLIISTFIGLTVVGIYSNYLLLFTTITVILARFFGAFRASLGNLYAKESLEKRYAFFEICNFLAFLLYGTAGVGVAVCIDEMLTAWVGSDYVIAQPLALMIGAQIVMLGIKTSLGQIRYVTGAYRQMWYRPLISIVINLVVSIVMVNVIGIYGVVLGTLCADIFADFLIDPIVINKHCLESYKPVFRYYSKQFMYMAVLALIGLVDYFICLNFLTGLGWLSVIVHVIICGLSVPLVFCLLFRNSHEFKYLFSLAKKLIKKR